ncbi:hypothetical protein [Mucilaginibacter arboris]|uniref:Uncharacterized protein n=1 Tax=Mucilaginibacter arboris TaxID=2682090 RepID=A0A7K1T1V5_9SPHI|nr:hypothetical protein [Mucilaginibacter arboris]MVN23498.1 hypothetical protein [Mucilaginibacter arboris]
MKKHFLFLALTFTTTLFAQTKTVFLTKFPKTVPIGKKWIVEANKPTKIQVGQGVLNSGSFCNAMFLSNPQIVYNINRGTIYEAESFGIIFKNLEKVPYTNDITYNITPVSFIDKTFSLSKLQTTSPENVGAKKLEFMAGESVFIGNCLESIELVEVSMTPQEILSQKNKTLQLRNKENFINSNLNIPINTEKAVEPGTKPQIQDKNLQYIVFTSTAVLWKKPGKGTSVDESEWTLTLTPKIFEMKSMNYEKKFKVVGVKYDEDFQAQKFELADNNGTHTFDLLLSYSLTSKTYSAIVGSIDFKEEYQFQEVTAKEKEFQK